MRKNEESLLWQFFFALVFLTLGILLLDRENLLLRARSFLEKYSILAVQKPLTESERTELAEMRAKSQSLAKQNELLRGENEDLRRQLEAPLPPSAEFIPAKIIAVKGENFQDEKIMTVEAGREQGLKKDMPVLFENILLGRISDVGVKLSAVKLLSDPQSKIAVKTESRIKGLLVGGKIEGGENVFSFAVMESILQKDKIGEKDQVLTSGEDGLPADLLIGEVVLVISKERDPFKSAKIKLFLNPKELERVFVGVF